MFFSLIFISICPYGAVKVSLRGIVESVYLRLSAPPKHKDPLIFRGSSFIVYKTAARAKSPAITIIENDKSDAVDILWKYLFILVIVHENRLRGAGFG